MPNRLRHDWKKLRLEWLSGKWPSLRAMARDLKLSESTLGKRGHKEGWIDRREQIEEKVEMRVDEAIVKMRVKRHVEIYENQLKYAQVMLGLSLNTFQGKEKLEKDSDAISMLRLAIDTQLRALQALAKSEDNPVPEGVPVNNIENVNIVSVNGSPAQDWTNDQINARLKQIQDEKKKIMDRKDG